MEAATLPATSPEGVVIGGVRVWLRAEALAVVALSVFLYGHLGGRWWLFAVLLLAPDLSMLGYLINARVGGAAYNLVHSYVLPLVTAAVAMAMGRSDLALLACIWTAHIGLDRMLGYGLKYSASFGKTHLGLLGKARAQG